MTARDDYDAACRLLHEAAERLLKQRDEGSLAAVDMVEALRPYVAKCRAARAQSERDS